MRSGTRKKAEAFKRRFYGMLNALPITRGKPVKIWFADESRYGPFVGGAGP
jgi:hypothetical protein